MGTSKREQGVETPRRKDFLKCGCILKHSKIIHICQSHIELAKIKEREKKQMEYLAKIKADLEKKGKKNEKKA